MSTGVVAFGVGIVCAGIAYLRLLRALARAARLPLAGLLAVITLPVVAFLGMQPMLNAWRQSHSRSPWHRSTS